MKQIILLLFIIFSSLTVEAKKMNFPLEIITGSADLIVIGEINSVKNNSYTFRISETLKGHNYKSISVKTFSEWLCDPRFFKLEKGQKLCLFLKKGLSSWEVINGGTGELFISGSLVYLGGDDSMKIVNNKIESNTLSLLQFKNGIRDFCRCYQFIGEFDYLSGKPQYFIQICSDLQISNFKIRSEFSEWLFEKMERYYGIQKIVTIDYNNVLRPIEVFRQNTEISFVSNDFK
jgi:hypothetical protein